MKKFSVKNGFGFGAIIFALAAIIALPIRTVQYFTVLEGGTGFFTSNNWSVYLLYAVLAVSTIAFIVLGLSKRKKLDFLRKAEKRPVFGIFSLISAAGIFSDGINCISEFINNAQPIVSYDHYGAQVINTEKLLFGCEAVFAAISAIFFLAMGLAVISGKTNGSEFRIISLSPIIWAIFRTVFRFTRTISYLRVSELTFELLMLIFMIMFFMAFAQVNAQISSKNCEWKLAGYGLPAALLAIVCFVPRLIVTLIGRIELLYSYSPVNFCDLAVSLFIIATVFTRLTDKVETTESTEPEEKEAVNTSVEE